MGTQRQHGKPKGRPTDKKYIDKLRLEIARLQALNAHRLHNDPLWKAIGNLIAIAETLETQTSYNVTSKTWDNSGHSADIPLLPGTYLADDNPTDEHPDGDGTTNKGDRNLYHVGYHSGKHAHQLLDELVNNINWVAQKARDRLVLRDPPLRPRQTKMDHPQDCIECAKSGPMSNRTKIQ